MGEIRQSDRQRIENFLLENNKQFHTAADIGHELSIPTRRVSPLIREMLNVTIDDSEIIKGYKGVEANG